MDSKIISFFGSFKYQQKLIVVKKVLDNESLNILEEFKGSIEEILNSNGDIVQISDLKMGDDVTVKFSPFHLNKFGIYYDQESFLKKNRIETINTEYYLLKEKFLSSENNDFNNSYKSIIKLIQSLKTRFEIKGIANITGGGLTENIPRIFPKNVSCEIDLNS